MVISEALKTVDIPRPTEPSELPEEELPWCSVPFNEVFERGMRLEASVFGIEGKHVREVLKQCKWATVPLCGENGLAEAYHCPRFKRIWVGKPDLPIYQPSQITEIKPEPAGYLSSLTKTDIEALRVHRRQVLLTCSGSIGICSYVSRTLDGKIFSHDLIRMRAKNDVDSGYIYAFLRTKIGNALIRTNEYGAVVSHIEPEHLESMTLPNPPELLKRRIHDFVFRSHELRDESNALLDRAETLLIEALKLPPLEKLRPPYFDKTTDLRNYTVKLKQLAGRLDASYHVPIVDAILQHLKKEAAEVTIIGDRRISKRVMLPGRFARVYVEEGQGTVFFGGKQIFELDPTNKKYLSLAKHGERIKRELLLKQNMVLVTRSGTIGKVALVPVHWEKWVANEHIIRMEPSSDNIAGYLYVFLATDYGRELVTRFTYGAVVDEIDNHHVSEVPVPLLKDVATQAEINRLALEANIKRTEAYRLEQEAIRIINEEVIHSENDETI